MLYTTAEWNNNYEELKEQLYNFLMSFDFDGYTAPDAFEAFPFDSKFKGCFPEGTTCLENLKDYLNTEGAYPDDEWDIEIDYLENRHSEPYLHLHMWKLNEESEAEDDEEYIGQLAEDEAQNPTQD